MVAGGRFLHGIRATSCQTVSGPAEWGRSSCFEGGLGAPAASGLTYVVLYEEHHPPLRSVDSSPFRWFIPALDARRAALRPPFQARYPSSELRGVAARLVAVAVG